MTIIMTVLQHWSFSSQVVLGLALAALVYWRGRRITQDLLPRRNRWGYRPGRAACFYGGLAVIFVALDSPVDYYSHLLMWMHMVQHLLMIMLAAPLIILGDPAVPFMRVVPLSMRRRIAAGALHSAGFQRLQKIAARVFSPIPVEIMFTVDFWAWHWSKLYNLTLQNQVAHDLEHLMFVGTALLFWSQIIDQHPFHCHMSYVQRAMYVFAAAVQNHILALYFAFMPTAVYSVYASEVHRPGNITAVADQQYAGAIMWVPGMLLYGAIFSVCLYQWLARDERPDTLRRRTSLTQATRATGSAVTS